jgi:hypothetical protein
VTCQTSTLLQLLFIIPFNNFSVLIEPCDRNTISITVPRSQKFRYYLTRSRGLSKMWVSSDHINILWASQPIGTECVRDTRCQSFSRILRLDPGIVKNTGNSYPTFRRHCTSATLPMLLHQTWCTSYLAIDEVIPPEIVHDNVRSRQPSQYQYCFEVRRRLTSNDIHSDGHI